MLNIIGISLGFLGAVISVFDVVFGNPLSDNWLGTKKKRYTIAGLSLIGLGFLLQLISAIMQLN